MPRWEVAPAPKRERYRATILQGQSPGIAKSNLRSLLWSRLRQDILYTRKVTVRTVVAGPSGSCRLPGPVR
jgi:hypothetical protein